MKNAVIAKVVVDQTVYHFDKPYDYYVAKELKEYAKPGCRVLVPFGRGNRKRQGVIVSISPEGDTSKLKPIAEVIDSEPLLSNEMIKLVVWMKKNTFCTYFDAIKTILPAGISMKMTESYQIADGVIKDDIELLQGDCHQLAEMLFNSGGEVKRSKVLKLMGLTEETDLPERLIKKGIIIRSDKAVQRIGDAAVKMVRLIDEDRDYNKFKLTEKQRSVVDVLLQGGTANTRELCYFTGVTIAVINALHKKGIVEFFDQQVYRTPYEYNKTGELYQIILTDEQQNAYNSLVNKYSENKGGAALLYGVTGSGKTQVFLKMVDKVAESGKGVIVMVPEIALTTQTIAIFQRRYGDKIAVLHSAMSLGQRMDEWKRIKNGQAKIAIGTRSAVFAPFKDLGLIIMDEEHEHTYKSEKSPRYHARDIARFRCAEHKALLILASATPSIESFSAALSERYLLCRLNNRYGKSVLPEVVTVDMREEIASGNTGPFSRFLIDSINNVLDNGQQAILLLNRRGHNTFVSCPSCGQVMMCPNCTISMTYHSANKRLMCHYCGYSDEYKSKCPKCGSEHIRYSGLGTQKVEEELNELFPDSKILRMDADSAMSRIIYDENLSAFAAGEYEIMLGTQMVAKGLNFPNVTLVGVLGADQSMYSDNYRSFERSFSLLTQVVGRSGRGDKPGVALIQTINPDSSVIKLAADQDYDAFYKQEIMSRKMLIFPPYCELVLTGFVSENYDAAKDGAFKFFDILKDQLSNSYKDIKVIILGPLPAAVPKVSNKYRYRMLIKCKNTHKFRDMIHDSLMKFSSTYESKKVSIFIDANPEGTI